MACVLQHGVTNSPETTLLLLYNALEIAGRRFKKNLALLACVAGAAREPSPPRGEGPRERSERG
jgi:hypothetical protein